ncbi:acetylglutamate kinase [Psychrosphaera sp. B3R10]|uniref:acetylglutamate kinase n=1 Tax=unclassified Psychrosphaera TaxID=2641570 RepID=UPI001C0A43EE|nr:MULTISPECIES: acetylglutamate kinase [unclassified Psychrosphaera]MBU2881607.1 acetylglutamate kinase [Psychrosphaera sp. I2R16]MBU2991138.1 acetylglutamate kinase [Psychrosphaera sp. B3R10]MDO6719535.1 acetylglutamate kinase [Psychrosphaera sp. 1_MG-2023]
MTPLVLKIGGEALTNQLALDEFLTQVKIIQKSRPVIIVHGGGPQVEDVMAATNLSTEKVDGVRATPLTHLPYVIGALAGIASQQLLAACKKNGLNAVALSLADGDSFTATVKDKKLGAVGKVEAKSNETFTTLLNSGHLIVLNSIGCNDSGDSLNINADDAAVAAAQVVNGDLCLLSNVPGVLDQNKQKFATLNREELDKLIIQGVISDGMVVKVNAAHQAALSLRRPVNIGSWQDSSALKEISEAGEITLGTQIQI